ncbi:MAG: CerR family C-terminal domain-containing protein [Pirellulales bacterium]
MADARNQLLIAAGEVFAEKGYKAATVREICSRAHVNLASVNYYFGDKERLYIEAVKNARRLREAEAPLPRWSADTPPEKKLQTIIFTLLQRMLGADAAPWQLRLIQREIMEPTKACEEMVQEAFEPYFQNLLEVLKEMLPPEISATQLHQLGFSVIGQCVFYRAHDKIVSMLVTDEELAARYRPDQLAEHISQVTLAALGVAQNFGASPSVPPHDSVQHQ